MGKNKKQMALTMFVIAAFLAFSLIRNKGLLESAIALAIGTVLFIVLYKKSKKGV